MMLCTIKKAFPFSRDGITAIHAEPGTHGVDIPDALVPGLTAAGYVVADDDAVPSDEKAALVAEAEALGITIDGRWGVSRLQAEIEAKKAAS